jgi:hypothetical protein
MRDPCQEKTVYWKKSTGARMRHNRENVRPWPFLIGGWLFAALATASNFADTPPEPTPYLSKEELDQRRRAAGDDPLQLLALTPLVKKTDAKRLRNEVGQLLRQQLASSGFDKAQQVSKRLAPLLSRTIHSSAQFSEIMGSPQHICRQIVYRRHVEQWICVQPLPICIVFDRPKGQDSRVHGCYPFVTKISDF